MRRTIAIIAGLLAGMVAWYVIIIGIDAAVAHVNRLIGMIAGGDVAWPFVALIAGALYTLAVVLIVVSACMSAAVARRVLVLGMALAVLVEFMLASYIVGKRRFISPEYDSLPGPSPVQIGDDATIIWHITAVTAAHVLLFVASTAAVFFVARAITRSWPPVATPRG